MSEQKTGCRYWCSCGAGREWRSRRIVRGFAQVHANMGHTVMVCEPEGQGERAYHVFPARAMSPQESASREALAWGWNPPFRYQGD